MQKHCGILNYLEDHNKDLFAVVNKLCLSRLFLPPRFPGGGLTFLNPDKTLTKKLVDMTYSKTPEDALAAIKALLVRTYLPQPADWIALKGKLGNALNQQVEVVAKKDDVVVLHGKAQIKLDKAFQHLTHYPGAKSNLAVYALSGELLPTNAPASERMERPAPGADMMRGGPRGAPMQGGAENVPSTATRVEYNEHLLHALASFVCDEKSFQSVRMHPHMEAVVSLAEWSSTHKPELHAIIRSIVDYDPVVTMCLLLQPYRSEHVYVSDSELHAWLRATAQGRCNAERVADAYEALMGEGARGEGAAELMQRQRALMDPENFSALELGKHALEIVRDETLLQKTLPEERVAVYRAHRDLLAAEAEARHVLSVAVEEFTRDCMHGDRVAAVSQLQGLMKLFRLDAPVLVFDSSMDADTAYFHSNIRMLARSDLLVFASRRADAGDNKYEHVKCGDKQLARKAYAGWGLISLNAHHRDCAFEPYASRSNEGSQELHAFLNARRASP